MCRALIVLLILVCLTENTMEDINVDEVKTEEKVVSSMAAELKDKIKEEITKGDDDLPSTLEGFKYAFNDKGELRHIESGERFVFAVKDEHSYNQKRYEALGEILNNYVFDLLESEAQLEKVYIPADTSEDEPRSFIFMSKDALSNTDKLMILIHGSGVVRAGQWARRLIINDCLDSGTQLPFIKRAMTEGYGVIVLNTNYNDVVKEDGTKAPIRHNASPEDHAEYVWNEFVSKASAKHIAIVAHSYGGIVTTNMGMKFEEDFESRVFAIAFTDSVHSLQVQDCPESAMNMFEKIAQNWVSSDEPLDTPMPNFRRDCPMVSAGHPKHENTSWSSFTSIFKFFAERYSQTTSEKVEKEETEEKEEKEEKDTEKVEL